MATTVDTLVTKYVLDNRGYKSGAAEVESSTGGLAQAFSKATAGAGLLSNAAVGVGIALAGLVLGAVATVGITAKIAQSTVGMSVEFDRMAATIGGALGGIDKGVAVMKSLEFYATKSAFGLNDLATAATQMVAAGLNIKTLLPVAERFALVIGGTNPEGLQMVVRALTLAKGGAFGEAMETLRRAGVGRADFEKQGIKVGAGGQIQSTPEEFVNAIIRISEGRPKDMADAIGKSDAVALSNVSDALQSAMRQMGAEISKTLVPMIREFTASLVKLTDSGAFTSLGNIVGSFIDDLKNHIGDFETAMVNIVAGIQTMYSVMTGITMGLLQVGKWILALVMPIGGAAVVKNITETFDSARAGVMAGMSARAVRGANAGAEFGLLDTGDTNDPKDTPPVLKDMSGYLQQIAQNTKPDLKKIALGGGNLGALGISATSLSEMRGRRGTKDHIMEALEGWVDRKVAAQLSDILRNQQSRAGVGF